MLIKSAKKAFVEIHRGLFAGVFAVINLVGIASLGAVGYYLICQVC